MILASKFLSLLPEEVTPQAEEEFFTSLKLRNGTYKTTFQNRFSDINLELRRMVESGDVNVDNILDIGISSGSSTLELYQELGPMASKSKITGTDLMPEAYLVNVLPCCFALVDSTGYPLRYDIFNWSMKPWVVSSDYRNGFFIIRKCANIALGYRAGMMIARPGSRRVQKVELITPILRNHANVIVKKDDITKYNITLDGMFNFVRAANVLNRGYFTEATLMGAVDNIIRYLAKPRATLLVARTHGDGVNHGTLFEIGQNAECVVKKRFGRGSEVEEIILERLRGLSYNLTSNSNLIKT